MSKKLIRTETPVEGIEVSVWEVENGYQVSVVTDGTEFNGEDQIFETLEEALGLLDMIPSLIEHRDEMLHWLETYESVECLPSVYDFETYEDVVQHILDRHGDEGRAILENPNKPPVIWHQWRHAMLGDGVVMDHTHEGTSPVEFHQSMKRMMGTIENPLFAELLKTDSMQEELVEASQKLQDIYERNGIKFEE